MVYKMSFTYITIYVTIVMERLLTSQAQFLPQVPFSFPQGMSQPFMQMPEGQPGMAGAPQMTGMPQISGMPQMSGLPQMQPMPMSMPGHMPMHFPMSQPRLPVVVMPYYSKNSNKPTPKFRVKPKRHAKKKYLYQDSESGENSDESNASSGEYNFRRMGGKVKKSRQVLTPVVSYVTKDGYVVFQKKIKKDRARDWLEIGNRKGQSNMLDADHYKEESGERFKDVKRRLKLSNKRSHSY